MATVSVSHAGVAVFQRTALTAADLLHHIGFGTVEPVAPTASANADALLDRLDAFGHDSDSYAGEKVSATSDGSGFLEAELLRGSWYVARRGQGPAIPFQPPDEPTMTLPKIPSRAEPL